MKDELKDFFKDFAKREFEHMDKGTKEMFKQTWEYNEPLFNLILKIKKELELMGQNYHVYLDIDWLFDVEVEDGEPEITFRNEDEISEYFDWEDADPDSWESTGWEKMSLDSEFARLLGNWNWDNLRLENGRILLFSRDGFLDEPVFYAVDENKLTDDILTMWGHKGFADAMVNLKLSTIK